LSGPQTRPVRGRILNITEERRNQRESGHRDLAGIRLPCSQTPTMKDLFNRHAERSSDCVPVNPHVGNFAQIVQAGARNRFNRGAEPPLKPAKPRVARGTQPGRSRFADRSQDLVAQSLAQIQSEDVFGSSPGDVLHGGGTSDVYPIGSKRNSGVDRAWLRHLDAQTCL
jgi:hypothetical protein